MIIKVSGGVVGHTDPISNRALRRAGQGEHYPCKPDVFEQTYELAEDGND